MKNISKILLFLLVAVLGVAMVSCKKKDNPSDDKKIEEVTFENVPTSMYVNDEFTIGYSKQEGVTANFSINNAEIAKVEGEKVTALKEGQFTLTAKFELDDLSKEYKFDINVVKAVYAITYNLNDGVQGENAPASYDVRNLPLSLVNPSREGYTFAGWYNNADFSGEALTKVAEGTTGDVALYAKWEKNKVYHKINYTLNGGKLEGEYPTQFEEGVGVTLPVPTKEGYVFLGWAKTALGTSYITKIDATVTKDMTVYAKWEKEVIYSEIVYELDGGVNPEGAATKYEEGKAFTLPVPTQEGYKFLGWSLEAGSTTYITSISASTTGKVTVYANWEEIKEPVVGEKFTVDFELNGGAWTWTTGTVVDAAKGIDAVSNLPEIFMADFYAYLSENNLLNSSKVSTKIQVNTWAAFSANNGDPVALYNTTSTVKTGAADGYSELFFDSVNGYEAVGGFLGTSPYKEKYANVTKHMIQMTLYRYSTVPTTDKTFKAGAGFVLDGYFYGTQGLLASSKANYQEFNALRASIPTPTVGYDNTTATQNTYLVSEGVVGTELKLVAPVKEGHMFLGWYDNAEFTGEKVTSVTAGCKLYACWFDLNAPAPEFNIVYELDGGTNPSNAPLKYTQGEGATLPKPTMDGYTFIGWSTDAEGKNIITSIPTTAHGDFTVYANWVEGEDEVLKVNYVYNDGKLPTRTPSTLNEVIEYVFTSYYNWLKPSDDYETFKTKVIAQWKDKQSQGDYKFYKQNGKDTVDAAYFCNAPENFDEWNAWFTVFDAQVTAANGAQNAWNSYVGILRLGQWLSGNSPVTWKDSMNQALIAATQIKIPLVEEVKVGEEVVLLDLVIEDGRTFLGWYDENGNKVEKLKPTEKGSITLTAKWSEAVAVESFEVTNEVNKLLKFSTHQLRWEIGPSNATLKKVTFASSDTSILKVDEKGLIEAVSCGTAKVIITVHGNQQLNTEIEIEVYVDPYIDGKFVEESYVVVNQEIQLGATLVGSTSNKLTWTSKTPDIAKVDESGVVSGVKEGLAEIVVADANNSETTFTFYVTVLAENPTGILELLVDSNNKEIYRKDNLLIGIKIGSDGAYYSDIRGSVSKLLFEDYVVYDDYYLANPNNKSNFSTGGVQFITVHYAADMPYSASAMYNGGKNLASYNKSCNTSGTQASWHYSTGNDGIWACQTEAYGAWHAGSSKTMTWTNSGVTTSQVGTDVLPTDVKLGSDGYFYIKGVKTTVKNTTSSTKLNGMGLAVKLEGNTWQLGGHYFNSSYQYISSTGGNNNSIGMETSVREGSDLWLTWQYTAQLCAKLLLKYNLPIQRLVGHHFFSGKWCPQPMLENDLEIWHEFVELTKSQMDLYQNYADYKLSFSSNSSYLKENGRVKELPNYPECVTYTVTYTTGSTTKTITLSSILPGNLQ
ncbi:MAG: InlB B-repeat-containing protein [Bacilli bacterium]|nr:InlB B-repeat-containing protein [Bacilli bacterium]